MYNLRCTKIKTIQLKTGENGKCPFQKKKNPAFCLIFQTNQKNVSLLKLDFLKIEL